MRKIIFLLTLFTAKAATAQVSPSPFYIPNNPDSIIHIVNVNKVQRRVYNVDLLKMGFSKRKIDSLKAMVVPEGRVQYIIDSTLATYNLDGYTKPQIDSIRGVISGELNLKLNISDTTNMLRNYAKSIDLNNKVDKVAGKALSDRNYTNADSLKLAGIYPSGKTWLLFGDSFSSDISTTTKFPYLVANKLKLGTMATIAMSGNKISHQNAKLDSIITNNPSYLSGFDFVTIMVGANDYAGTPLGTIESDTNSNTMAGYLRRMIVKILNNAPNSTIYIITLPEANGAGLTYKIAGLAGWKLSEWAALIGNISFDYGVQVIDLYSNSQFNLKTIPTYTVDGLHPSATGSKIIGDQIISAFINKSANAASSIANSKLDKSTIVDYLKKSGDTLVGTQYINPASAGLLRLGASFAFNGYAGNGGGVSQNIYHDGSGWKYTGNGAGMLMWGGSAGEFSIYTAPSGSTGASASISNKFTVLNDGYAYFTDGLKVGGILTVDFIPSGAGDFLTKTPSGAVTYRTPSETLSDIGAAPKASPIFTGIISTDINTAPSSATDTGTTGEIRFTSTGIYICIATNTWIKCVGATF
jgi:lysophospholipase L1-like esterase